MIEATHVTRNKTPVTPTGRYYDRYGKRALSWEEADYIECLLVPIDPWRLERVNKYNLRTIV